MSGSNYTSHINIIRKGISIKDHITIDQLPAIHADGGLNCVGDKMFLRVFGIPQILVARISISEANGQRGLQINEIDTAKALSDIEEAETIMLMRGIKESDKGKDAILVVTDSRIRVTTDDLEQVLFERAFEDDLIAACDFQNHVLMVALTCGRVIVFGRPGDGSAILVEQGQLEFNFEVSSLALSADGRFACVNLYDMPLYSLYILDLSRTASDHTMRKLEQRSLLSILEYEAYQDMLTNTLLAHRTKSAAGIDQDMAVDDQEEQQQARAELLTVEEMYEGVKHLNCDLPCVAVRSVKILSTISGTHGAAKEGINTDLSYIVGTFGDGRTLTMSFDHELAREMAASKKDYDGRLEHVARNESGSRQRSSKTALGDYQILSIGTIEPTLRPLLQQRADGHEGMGP